LIEELVVQGNVEDVLDQENFDFVYSVIKSFAKISDPSRTKVFDLLSDVLTAVVSKIQSDATGSGQNTLCDSFRVTVFLLYFAVSTAENFDIKAKKTASVAAAGKKVCPLSHNCFGAIDSLKPFNLLD
jgi:hypothetical protein